MTDRLVAIRIHDDVELGAAFLFEREDGTFYLEEATGFDADGQDGRIVELSYKGVSYYVGRTPYR